MEQPTNLRNRPVEEEYADNIAARGSGQLNSINAYLQSDPVSYFYQKLKDSKNEFLRDDYWTEAAKRGESENLVALLNASENEGFNRKIYDAVSGYDGKMDYDSYMLALEIPHLDNTNKIDRFNEATGDKIGSFTDQEWGLKVIDAMTQRWDAEIVELDKETRSWLAKIPINMGTGIATVVTAAGGAMNFLGDMSDLLEGALLVMVDWNNKTGDNAGEKFLSAYADGDNYLTNLGDWLTAASFEYQRRYSTRVNAVKAYDEGYSLGEGDNFLEQIDNAVGVGTGYSDKILSWGRWVNAGAQAIGYMVPTMMLGGVGAAGKTASAGAKVLGAASKVRSGIFYAGIFSGMVRDNVKQAELNGISYKDLNSGMVIANAGAKSLVQYAIERTLGMIVGFSAMDRALGMGTTSAAKAGTKAATAVAKGGMAAAKLVLMTGVKDALKEGTEEVLQGVSDYLIDYAFNEDYRERAIDNFTPQSLVDSFVVAALMSAVVGSMVNVKVFLGQRSAGIGIDGKTFEMGAYQTIALRQAVEIMNEWRDTINDKDANIEKKAAAMLSLNAAISTLGTVYSNMGIERAKTADTIIMDILKMQDKLEKVNAIKSEVEYANKLWATFEKAQETAQLTYVLDAIKKEKDKLQKAGISKIDDVITDEVTSDDPKAPISANARAALKSMLKKLGVKAIVGVDGKLVLKSEDVLFVNTDLLKRADIEDIVRGTAYSLVLETVKSNLNRSQNKLIVEAYNKVTGLNGSIDDAITALLFDKEFYTHILLLMKERNYGNQAFKLISVIDEMIFAKLTPNVTAGTITEKAYKVLLEKVRDTMRSGLVHFSTIYYKLDLGNISNAILPMELKQIINANRNVQFTQIINDILVKQVNEAVGIDRAEAYDKALEKFSTYITKEQFELLKQKVRSNQYNDRVDAAISLVLLSKNFDQTDKVVYLPAFETSDESLANQESIKQLEAQFGVPLQELIDGTYDVNLLTAEIVDFITTNGYVMANTQSRHSAIRTVLFNRSGKTLTLGTDGQLLQVISKSAFYKERYLGTEGDKTLTADIKDGTVKTLGDISKIPLDSRLSDIELQIDLSVAKLGLNGGFVDGENKIVLSGNDIVNAVMHELTHVTQSFFAGDTEYVGGGSFDVFKALPAKVRKSLLGYIKTNFTTSYDLVDKAKNPDIAIMYFSLAGELQANMAISSMMFEVGFRWKTSARETLISPDSKEEWSMTPARTMGPKRISVPSEPKVVRAGRQSTNKNEDHKVSVKMNPGIFNDKRFWIGAVNLTTGVIEETHTHEEANVANLGYDYSKYFTKSQIKKLDAGKNTLFIIDDDGEVYNYLGDDITSDIMNKLTKQIKIDTIKKVERNIATFKGKRFWSGSVNLTDGIIEETHTYEEAKAMNFHHTLYFSESQVEKMIGYASDVEAAFFWVEPNGTINGNWRNKVPTDIINKIKEQIEINKPTSSKNINEDRPITLTKNINKDVLPIWKYFIENASPELRDLLGLTGSYTENFEIVYMLVKNSGIGTPFAKVIDDYIEDYMTTKFDDHIDISDKDVISQIEETREYLKDYLSTNAKTLIKELKQSKELTSELYSLISDYTDAKNSLSPLPKGLSADSPVTVEAMNALRDDPTIQRRMRNAWLKRKDGTPLVFYRGWKTRYQNSEIHLAKDGNIPVGIKGGEFYTTNYKLGKEFGEKIEGFIVPITRAETKVYDFKESLWFDLHEHWTKEDKDIHTALYDLSRPFVTDIIVGRAMARGESIESFVTSRLNKDKLVTWNGTIESIMSDYKVTRDNAVTSLSIAATWKDANEFTTDSLIPVNILQGYKAILTLNTNEVLNNTISTNLVLLRGTTPIKITHSNKDINWDKIVKVKDTDYVNNKIARESNLKYFIRKGMPIQVSPKVRAFVVATTTDFNKLPNILKDKILKGDLSQLDIIDYVASAKSMNDYTFQAIAKYIYGNEEIAKLTFKETRQIGGQISELAALEKVLPHSELVRTPTELLSLVKQVNIVAEQNSELANEIVKATKIAQTVLVGGEFFESFADELQLLPIMMRHYNGSLTSIKHINNFGKMMAFNQEAMRLEENEATELNDYEDNETTEEGGKKSISKKTWNWIERMRRADVDYEYDEDTTESLDDINIDDKIEAIREYTTNELLDRVSKMTDAQKRAQFSELQAELKKSLATIEDMSDDDINKRYLAVLANETEKNGKPTHTAIPEPVDLAIQPRSTKNIKDHIRQTANRVKTLIAGSKRRYNSLPKSIQEVIDPKTYKLRKVEVDLKDGSGGTRLVPVYTKMSDIQLETLLTNLKEVSKRLNASIKRAEIKEANELKNAERLAKLAAKELKNEAKPKKTMKEKVDNIHKTRIINQTFSFDSRETITQPIKDMLNTQWSRRAMSKVKGLTNNLEQNVHNGKLFFEYNSETLLNMTTTEAEAAVRWFMDANLVGIAADSVEAQTYTAIRTYFLGWVLGETRSAAKYTELDTSEATKVRSTGQFDGFNANLKTRLENYLRTQTSVAGTALAVWNNVQGLINPIKIMMNASMEIAGVALNDTEKDDLLNAAMSNDIVEIDRVRRVIIERVNLEKTSKKTILRQITTFRSMMMLSSPITWLRNRISNFLLKRLNKIALKIGSRIMPSKTAAGQFKMNGVITPEIQQFINDNFIDNQMFDLIITKLSKYNPSDIQGKFKDATGNISKDAIFANMVIKSVYNEFYNQNLFNSKRMNQTHTFLMKMLSDNNYIREASIRYLGKIMAERGYSLTTGVTDAIMNDFASAIGQGMADYMHSDNFFNQFETVLAGKSEAGLFVYKLILPFGSASWNWFKAALRFSPIGLGQSIYKLATLEQQIIKAEAQWAKGTSQISSEFTESLIRRELGSGVIGTMSMMFGMILAGLGYVDLEEDDYGTPKLRIGNLSIDVSTIFGSSSALAGMALVKTWGDKDLSTAINAMAEPLLDGFFLTQILELDKYNNEGWASTTVNFMEQTLLSFIPNGFRWLSGATYTGKYKTNNFFQRAVARVPFFGAVFGLEKQVNPYTGDLGDAWDIFTRIVPFLEVRQTSAMEDETRALGITKKELRGSYTINGEKFELNSKDVAALNRMYGQWNAEDLVEFYDNRARYSVLMPNGKYKSLTYNQMTPEQRKNAIQNLFSKNAQYAKTLAWLQAGNTYYAGDSEYVALKKLGISGKLYKGNKGYVKG